MMISVMDSTLRDGEQTSNVSFSSTEKLSIAKVLLEDLKVDRLEIASARVSDGERQGAQKILTWAAGKPFHSKVEILGFVDQGRSIEWIKNAGGKVLNLLTKGSLKHCEKQLRKTPEQHISDIKNEVKLAKETGLTVNMYLEDWSGGMRDSKAYVHQMLTALKDVGIQKFMLADTLGILNHEEVYSFCKEIVDTYPSLQFDFHGHNDYDLGTANAYAAIKAGINCIHCTLNGLGERAGNVCLSSVIGVVKDHLNLDMQIDEKKLSFASQLIETYSGIRIPSNKPIIGESVFTQTSGIHADGDSKDHLYHNSLKPERFGREYSYALGKMSGQASIKHNLDSLGITLDKDEMKLLKNRIIELGDRKETVTREDLPFIISDVLHRSSMIEKVKVLNFSLSVADGLYSAATIKVSINGTVFQETASGDGQYDAFMNALHAIYKTQEHNLPKLIDYIVTIPPGGKTDALVKTIITWTGKKSTFKTSGLDSDQAVAAIKATVKMLNLLENDIDTTYL